MPLVQTRIDSPVGRLTLVARDDGLAAVLWPDDDPRRVRLAPAADAPDHPVLVAAARELSGYFAGALTRF
ncbi:MAG TPA: cysteine methyltransferase, partial [Sphingomonas sp.]|nr:cysteine methyltransferase [Sphingomonas sp.]